MRNPIRLAGFLYLAISGAAALAQTYPEKLIKIIVPFPPGGDLEAVARGLGEHFQKVWKQPYIVEHKAGAQAMIGTEYVANSQPDGYTLLICSVGPMTINPTLYSDRIKYSIGKDITPVSLIATTPMVLVAGSTIPAKTYQEFVSYGKNNPGKISYASAGIGNITHLTAELYMKSAEISAVHVPYKGAQAIISDLLGNHVDMYFNPLPSALSYVTQQGDKAKPLAVTSDNRSALLPDVPTLAELGMKGMAINSWYGLCAPGGTPKSIVDKLSAEVGVAIKTGEFPDLLRRRGMNPKFTTSEVFLADIQAETAQWKKIIQEKGIKVE